MLSKDDIKDIYPLTPMQEGMFYHFMMDNDTSAYIEQMAFVVNGKIEPRLVEKSVNTLLDRYDILRTVFVHKTSERPLQIVLKTRTLSLYYKDLSVDENAGQFVERFKESDKNTPFDLGRDLLIRVALFRMASDRYLLVWTHHHILMDGWCIATLNADFFEIYQSFAQNRPVQLAPVTPFRNYIEWLDKQDKRAAQNFWKGCLQGYTEVVRLPQSNFKHAYEGPAQLRKSTALGRAVSRRIGIDIPRECHTTLSTVVQAAWAVVLSKYNQCSDVIFGCVVAGRPAELAGVESIVGLFINTIPVRVRVDRNATFRTLLDNVNLNAIENSPYHYTPLADIQSYSSLKQDLINHILIIENYPVSEQVRGVAEEEDFVVEKVTVSEKTNYDFNLVIIPGEHIVVQVDFNPARYHEKIVAGILGHFEHVLEQVATNIDRTVGEMELLPVSQVREILEGFNENKLSYPADVTLIDFVDQHAGTYPDRLAVVCGSEQITYASLREQSVCVAQFLVNERKHIQGDFVGVQMDRGIHWIVAFLGVLRAGGIYVPIDKALPYDRKQFILEDTRLRTIVCDEIDETSAPDSRHVLIATLLDRRMLSTESLPTVGPKDLAYLIYTSGSTGRPKGVLVEHGGIVNLGCDHIFKLGVTEADCISQFFAMPFDGSVIDMAISFCAGSVLVIIAADVITDKDTFLSYLEEKHVTVLQLLPSYLSVLEGATMPTVKSLVTAGEAANVKDARYYAGFKSFYNGYGPTEATVNSTLYKVDPALDFHSVPIGFPSSNKNIYIVDEFGNLVPIGVIGEIYVAGTGVARGYLNNPGVTRERFLPSPFVGGETMYRTGDLGFWDVNGEIVYRGRKDSQIKVRGFRIELDEIRECMIKCQGVREAVVIAFDTTGGDKQLAGFYTAEANVACDKVKTFLHSQLPGYMVPAYVLSVPRFELTANGKIDHTQLPRPAELVAQPREMRRPTTRIQHALLKIWGEVLMSENISIDDNFFDIGGHSLKAMRIVSHVQKTLKVRIQLGEVFEHPTILSLSDLMEKKEAITFRKIVPVPRQEHYALSHAQRRMWVVAQMVQQNVAYNMPSAYVFEGDLDQVALNRAFVQLVERHESLRTSFQVVGEEPRQVIHESDGLNFAIRFVDLSEYQNPELHARRLANDDAMLPFDLTKGPLVRATALRISSTRHIFLVTIHHIISDGWSMTLVVKELLQLYNAAKSIGSDVLQPLPFHYKDYAAWHSQQLSSEYLDKSKTYWQTEFSNEPAALDLALDRPRASRKSFLAEKHSFFLGPELSSDLRQLSRVNNVSLFITLLASLKLLFFKYTGQEDIIIGTPSSGRDHKDLENQIGFFVNTLAIRTVFSSQDTFASLVRSVRTKVLGAFEHQHYPYDRIVDDLKLFRDTSRNPLFDVVAFLQDDIDGDELINLNGIVATPFPADAIASVVDLRVIFKNSPGGIAVNIEYNKDLFDRERIGRMGEHYEVLVRAAVENPFVPIAEFDCRARREVIFVREKLQQHLQLQTPAKTIVELFEEQALKTPDRMALTYQGRSQTYKQLNDAVNSFADQLTTEYHVRKSDTVALMIERSEQMIIGLLAILKVGAIYLPIDPGYPADRKKYIFQHAGVGLLLTDSTLIHDLDIFEGTLCAMDVQCEMGRLVGNPPRMAAASDPAYIIYTSGSTGRPKGVMISHQSNVNMSMDQVRKFGVVESDVVLQFASLSFDASVSEIFMAFYSGASLLIMDKGEMDDPDRFIKFMKDNRVNVVTLPPSYLNILAAEDLSFLRVLITAGEAANFARPLAARCFNAYGPTEYAVCATIYELNENDFGKGNIPIGQPIANTQLYVLDKTLQHVPIGVKGELYIGGVGLAMEYVKSPELTAEKFVNHPFRPGEKLYRTGDVVVVLPDGNIEFRGRIDNQVKIRGFRIELDEVLSLVRKSPLVKDAFVARATLQDDDFLAAYIVPADGFDIASFRAWLSARLPSYMVPSGIVTLPELPRTVNGKIDQQLLPPAQTDIAQSNIVLPASQTEKVLAEIWKTVLNISHVSTRDNFFEIGGHSLKATQVVQGIYKHLYVRIDLADVFEYPTIQRLAEFVSGKNAAVGAEIPVVPVQPHYDLTLSQMGIWISHQHQSRQIAYNCPSALQLNGPLDATSLERAFRLLLGRHESLRTVFPLLEAKPRQKVLSIDELSPVFEVKDVAGQTSPHQVAQQIASDEAVIPFDLEKGPLVRATLVRMSDTEHVLIFVAHHIIMDGWSMQVAMRELWQFYQSDRLGETAAIAPLELQYKDYASWNNRLITDGKLSEQRDYWLSKFNGVVPVLDLATDHPRYGSRSANGGVIKVALGEKNTADLKALANREGASLFMTLMATVKALLHCYTSQSDIVVGSPVAGRMQPGLEDQIGLYMNTVAMRTSFSSQDSFAQLLGKVRTVVLEAFQHQHYPFPMLVQDLDLAWSDSRNPLFDVSVVLHNTNISSVSDLNGIPYAGVENVRSFDFQLQTNRFDITFNFSEQENDLLLLLEFNNDLFAQARMNRIIENYKTLLECVTMNSECLLCEVEYLSKAEKAQLLNSFNND